jgi:ribonuclease HI
MPLKSILVNRHIGHSGQCPICSLAAEDVSHLLFLCPAVTDIWEILGLSPVIDQAVQVDRSGSAVLEFILRDQVHPMPGVPSMNMKEVIVTACWYIWWIRRRRVRNEEVPPIFKCKMSILSIISNAAKANIKPTEQRDTKWVKPSPRQVKLNVDASFFENDRAGGVGAVLRDYQGNFLAASCKFLPHIPSASMAEAMAMREGLALANTTGSSWILAESMEVIQSCVGQDNWWGDSAAIYADCVDMSVSIGNVSFRHSFREANKVAHVLARESFCNKLTCNWVEEPPGFLLDDLLNDVTVL